MHELSIADAIVGVAASHAKGRQVTVVEVKVGHLRQVVPDALEFAFGLVAEGTPVEGARLQLEVVPARGRCRDCRGESALDGFPLVCGLCASFDLEVIAGEELLVDTLELEEDADELATIGGGR